MTSSGDSRPGIVDGRRRPITEGDFFPGRLVRHQGAQQPVVQRVAGLEPAELANEAGAKEVCILTRLCPAQSDKPYHCTDPPPLGSTTSQDE